MMRSIEDLDLELDLEVADTKRGPVGKAARVVTFPFRLVGGAIGLVVKIVAAVLGLLLLPFVLAGALVKKVVGLVADLVYGVVRLVAWVVGLVLGAVMLVVKLIDATVGNLVRLVFRMVFGTLRLLIKIITFGKLGKKAVQAASDPDA